MRIGIALSGGGVKGAAHLGVLKALQEYNIKPKLVAGTSSGAMVAGFYASGFTIEQTIKIAKKISWKLFDFSTSRIIGDVFGTGWRYARGRKPYVRTSGIIPAKTFTKFLTSYLGDKKLGDLKMPIALTAVDINKGDLVVFTNVSLPKTRDYVVIRDVRLVDAIRASMALPVIFTPKMIKGRRLVDGGIVNNLPVDILYTMGADKVIGVDLGYSGELEQGVDNLFEIGAQSLDIMGYTITKLRRPTNAFIIEPEIYNVGTLDFKKIPECIDRGYEAANIVLSYYKNS